MVAWLEVLSLTPEQATWVGAIVLVALHVTDVITSNDDIEGNAPRDVVIKLTQWRRGCLSGAYAPFWCGALVGHFFHPFSKPPIDLGWWGIGSIGLLSFAVSLGMGWMGRSGRRLGAVSVVWIALAGIVAGVLLWPVG